MLFKSLEKWVLNIFVVNLNVWFHRNARRAASKNQNYADLNEGVVEEEDEEEDEEEEEQSGSGESLLQPLVWDIYKNSLKYQTIVSVCMCACVCMFSCVCTFVYQSVCLCACVCDSRTAL